MAKSLNDAVLDAGLDEIATGTILTVCSAEPTNRTEAVTTYALADVTIDASDFSKADGSSATGGRTLTVAAQNSVLIDTTGSPTHLAICDATDLLFVTTATGSTLTANGSNVVNIPEFDITFADPT